MITPSGMPGGRDEEQAAQCRRGSPGHQQRCRPAEDQKITAVKLRNALKNGAGGSGLPKGLEAGLKAVGKAVSKPRPGASAVATAAEHNREKDND